MNFRNMCESYIEMEGSATQMSRVRRKIWPQNVHLLLGADTGAAPRAVVVSTALGARNPEYLTFGMSLVVNGETVIFGWCPPIEDVLGQDWEFLPGS